MDSSAKTVQPCRRFEADANEQQAWGHGDSRSTGRNVRGGNPGGTEGAARQFCGPPEQMPTRTQGASQPWTLWKSPKTLVTRGPHRAIHGPHLPCLTCAAHEEVRWFASSRPGTNVVRPCPTHPLHSGRKRAIRGCIQKGARDAKERPDVSGLPWPGRSIGRSGAATAVLQFPVQEPRCALAAGAWIGGSSGHPGDRSGLAPYLTSRRA